MKPDSRYDQLEAAMETHGEAEGIAMQHGDAEELLMLAIDMFTPEQKAAFYAHDAVTEMIENQLDEVPLGHLSKDHYLILVPLKGKQENIVKGSGIIASKTEEGTYCIDYEGNLFNAENLKEYEERLYHAYSRQIQRYPTSVRMWLSEADLLENFEIVGLLNVSTLKATLEFRKTNHYPITEYVNHATSFFSHAKDSLLAWKEEPALA